MRLSVECGAFTRAADACRTANQIAALLAGSLSSRLVECAAMAGDDASSVEFAQAYDAGAREAVLALADLTHSFIGLGRLLDTTGAHHAAAEAASAQMAVVAYVGGSLDSDAFVRIRPAVPPSSLGAQEASLERVDQWILDRIEGFVWPGADVDRVRRAAGAWRRSAASVAVLTDHVEAATDLLGHQRSPEVPIAVAALHELASLINDTAWQLGSVATACEDYAAAVDDARARTVAILAEIGQLVVEGVAISVLVSGVTGGLGGTAAAGVALARVRAYAPRFHAALLTLRAGAATAAARLRTAHDELLVVRTRAEKFLRVPARNERGEMKQLRGWVPTRKAGWLAAHEKPPGHTVSAHVGKTVEQLEERCRLKAIDEASSFADQAQAEELIDDVLKGRASLIDDWLRSGSDHKLVLDLPFNRSTGITVAADGTLTHPATVRVVLIPSSAHPSGWQILTAFPR